VHDDAGRSILNTSVALQNAFRDTTHELAMLLALGEWSLQKRALVKKNVDEMVQECVRSIDDGDGTA
jgi:hypothetical protein